MGSLNPVLKLCHSYWPFTGQFYEDFFDELTKITSLPEQRSFVTVLSSLH